MHDTLNIKSFFSFIKQTFFIVLLYLNLKGNAQSLQDLKTTAAENNLELKAQYKIFEAKVEQVNQAKAWQDPNLSFGYFISPIETRVGPQIARFSLAQKLPWFGTFKARGNIAAFQAEAEFERFQDKKLMLFQKVAEQYYQLLALRHILKLEQKQLDILQNLKSIMQSRYKNNQAQLVDVMRVELDIDKNTKTLSILKKQDKAILAKLNQLMNQHLKTPIQTSAPELILNDVTDLNIDTLNLNHPRIEAIRKLQASNSASKELARKQAMPQFGFGIDYAIILDKNIQNPDAGQDALMPMLSMSLPIFGQKNRSKKKEANLNSEALEFQLENETQAINTELQIAIFKKEELNELLFLYDQQLIRLNDILELLEAALANSSADIEEVLRLQNERLIYQKQRTRTLADLQIINEKIMYLTQNE
jgi:outer membrane protein TolC